MKRALITGGAVRIGAEIAKFLKQNHYQVFVTSYNSLPQAQELLEQKYIDGFFKLNLFALQELDDIFTHIGHIDLLINNAAMFEKDSSDYSALSSHRDCLRDHLEINAIAPILITQKMAQQKDNSQVINMLDASVKQNNNKFFSYSLSKKLLCEATKSQALAFAPKLRVNAIAPFASLIHPRQSIEHFQKMIANSPLKNGGAIEEICRSIIFLEQNLAITGQVITLDQIV